MGRILSKAQRWRHLERVLSHSPEGIKVSTLVKKLGVHRSTIYRDIEQLSQAGLPIWQQNGMVGILTDSYLQPLQLNIYESLSLFIAIRLLTRSTNEFNPHVKSALQKIAALIPPPVSSHIANCANFLETIPEDKEYIHNLEQLIWAWLNRRRIKMWYQRTWTQCLEERLFDVYFIEPIETWNTCYVIGWDHLTDEMRVFKIKRIHRIEITNETYRDKNQFNSFAHWGNAWGFVFDNKEDTIEVSLKFAERAAFLVRETTWHRSQCVTDLEGGGCILTLRVNPEIFKIVYGLKSWIISWGGDVEVLEPESLRLEVIEEIARLNNIYAKHPDLKS